MKKVLVKHVRITDYRTTFFDKARTKLLDNEVMLDVVYGQAPKFSKSRNDEGHLEWGHRVINKFYEYGQNFPVWQPVPFKLRKVDLIILTQENRILSNYPFLLSRIWSKRKVAFWGHGGNFQASFKNGLREKWKKLLLNKVDWWFAYTEMSVNLILDRGYPKEQITCLNNAIDTYEFKSNLAAWSEEDVNKKKRDLDIAENDPVAIYCGSLYEDKNLELLISSAELIKEKMPSFHLLILGNGPLMPFIELEAKSRKWIHVLGIQKGMPKALYFKMSDVMLNPGLVGLHIVDAFCAGLVMCTTNTAKHSPEVAYLQNAINGISTEQNKYAFSAGVVDILTNENKLKTMQQAALDDSNFYTLDNMVDNFVNGIVKALN